MPRPCKKKWVASLPHMTTFTPGNDALQPMHINMSIEEYETIRLIDYLGKDQNECAKLMQTSRGTVQMLYMEARRKLSRCLIEGSQLFIAGGNYELDSANNKTGDEHMKVAVTYENGQVFQHFGHTQMFKLFTIKDQEIVETEMLDTNGNGHSALVGLLKSANVDVLICGGIGGGAKNALNKAGIQLYGGACGDVDEQVASFLKGNLQFNPSVQCSHHGEGHTCGSHGEQEHSCGNHGHSCH